LSETGEESVRRALAEALEGLDGDGRLTVVEIAAEGVIIYWFTRDEADTPRCIYSPVSQWPDLTTAGHGGERLSADAIEERLLSAAELTAEDRRVVLICTLPEGLQAAEAFNLLKRVLPQAHSIETREVAVDALLRQAVEAEPLRRRYELVVARPTDTGGLVLSSLPLFARNTVSGGEPARIRVHCEPGDERGTVFAVVAWKNHQSASLISVWSAHVPAGPLSVTARLARPGLVRFDEPPDAVRDDRSWRELAASLPDRFGHASGRVHLICAIEVSGDTGQVDERRGRARQIIATLTDVPQAQVTLITYGGHLHHWHIRDPEVAVVCRRSTPAEATAAIRELRAEDPDLFGDPRASQLEDALAAVVREVEGTRDRPPARTALLTLGDRPPHPPDAGSGSGLLACPHHYSWRSLVAHLRQYGVKLGAVHGPHARPGQTAAAVWEELSGGKAIPLEVVDPERLAGDLGLTVPQGKRVLFPLAEESLM
jgi:hypothetical protein